MTIDTETPNSPGWMLARLQAKLSDRTPHLERLFARYEGKLITNDGTVLDPQTSPAFARFWEISHTNFAEMIVKAPLNRMALASIRTTASNDSLGDSTAWNTCRSARLLSALPDALRMAKVGGSGYLIVGQPNGKPVVTAEDPRNVVTIHDPLDQSRVLYGAKFFHDPESAQDMAFLHVPGRVYKAVMPRSVGAGRVAFNSQWSWDPTAGGEEGLETGLRECAIKRIRNDEGVGEFERHAYLLDRIDHITLQGLVIATMQAFRQRAIELGENVDMPEKDENGNTIDWDDIFTSAPDRMWKLPAGVKIWESQAADLTPIWTGTEKYIQQLSAVTFTPLSMFSPEGQNQSAEGASLAREGLVAKTERFLDSLGETLADVVAMLFELAGDPERSVASNITLDFKPVERYGLSEKWQAGVNAKAAGVPWKTLMLTVGQFTPGEISRMESERNDDALLAQTMAQVMGKDTSNGNANAATAD